MLLLISVARFQVSVFSAPRAADRPGGAEGGTQTWAPCLREG